MSKKPKDLLQKEELKLDNHHPLIPLDWDNEHDKTIHVHKKMVIKNKRGGKTAVSASLNLNAKREIRVTYDNPKHSKIKDAAEEERCREQIIQEINECLEDPKEAASFIEHIHDAIQSLSSHNKILTQKRLNEAFDNVMGALGVPTDKKAIIKNNNGKILSLYMTGDYPGNNHIEHIKDVHKKYRNHYQQPIIDDYPLYFTVYEDKSLFMGEYSPESAMTYAFKGYKTWMEEGDDFSENPIEE